MAGLGFLGALGGLGDSISGQAASMQRQEEAAAQFNREKSLSEWKLQQQQLYKIQDEDRAVARQAAPLNRLSELAKTKLNEDMPVAAAAVTPNTAPSGVDPQATANSQGYLGSTGATAMKNMGPNSDSYADLVKRAENLPEEDRALYLAQIQRQMEAQQASNNTAAAGQTRKRTNDEAFDAALEQAKISDPQAYMAGRPLGIDKTIKLGANEAIYTAKDGKLVAANTRGVELEGLRTERQFAMQEANRRADSDNLTRSIDARATDTDKKIAAMQNKVDNRGSSAIGTQQRIGYTAQLRTSVQLLIDAQKRKKDMIALGVPKAGTPEADALAKVDQQIAGYEAERQSNTKLLFENLKGELDNPASELDISPAAQSAPAAAKAATSSGQIAAPKTQAEFNALPSGTTYSKDGKFYRKS